MYLHVLELPGVHVFTCVGVFGLVDDGVGDVITTWACGKDSMSKIDYLAKWREGKRTALVQAQASEN